MLSTQRAIQRKINMGKNNAHDDIKIIFEIIEEEKGETNILITHYKKTIALLTYHALVTRTIHYGLVSSFYNNKKTYI